MYLCLRPEEEIFDDYDATFGKEEPVPTAQKMVAFGELIIHLCLLTFALGQKMRSLMTATPSSAKRSPCLRLRT